MKETVMKNNIKINDNYRPSTNIKFDLGSESLVEGFIPTSSTLDLLEFLLQPVIHKDSNTFRSHLLTGAYGKGKSYSILLAIELLRNDISSEVKTRLVNKVRTKRPHLADKFNEIGIESKSKLLPVLVSGGYSSLSLTLSSALNMSLESANINDIVLNSNFHTALKYIDSWKNNYAKAFEIFNNLASTFGLNSNSFEVALKNNDEKAITIFKEIFPQITNGTPFDNISEFKVIEDYKNVSIQISKYGYSGLFIVYDEFSKFLESTHNEMSEGDIKLLQDLAELSNGSSSLAQIHLILVSHKIPTSYFSDAKSINEWEAISGRFDVKDLFGSNNQEYEIVEGMLDIDKGYLEKRKQYEKDNRFFSYFKGKCISKNLFGEDFENLAYNCYPLHPIALYVLPRLSEKIAQNERSIFSFMVSNAPSSLLSFITSNRDGERLMLDTIYDYFLPIFRNAPKNSIMFKVFLMVDSIENKDTLSPLAKKITKSIGILLLLNDDKLPASFDSLCLVYGLTKFNIKDLEKGNNELKERGVICQSEGTGEYLPFVIDPSIHSRIKRISNLMKKNLNLQNELTHLGFSLAYYPQRYNDLHSINRYFKIELISESTSLDSLSRKYKLQSDKGEGVVFVLLNSDEHVILKALEKEKNWKLCFFLVPKKNYNTEKLISTLCEYKGITEKLLNSNNIQPSNEAILRYMANDDLKSLTDMLDIFMKPSNKNLKCYVNGKDYSYNSNLDISELCSNLYDKYLNDTVIFNREDINLEKPAEVSVKARNIVVSCLLNKNIGPLRKFKETSQQFSIYSALCFNSNIIFEITDSDELYFDLTHASNKFARPIKYINSVLIESAKKEQRVFDIIATLKSVNGGFGIKKGLIPFFFAIACSKFSNNLVFYRKGIEASIGYKLFNSIVDNPSDYSVRMYDWGTESEDYLKVLCNKFEVNSLSFRVYEKLIQSMANWFELLPLQTRVLKGYFGKDGKVISFSNKSKKIYTNLMNLSDNPYSIIMEKLPSKIERNFSFSHDLAKEIVKCIEEIESAYRLSVKNMKFYFSNLLNYDIVGDKQWIVILHSWLDCLDINENNEYEMNLSLQSKKILKIIENESNEDILFDRLTKTMVGLRFGDWGKESVLLFYNAIKILLNDVSFSKDIVNETNDTKVAQINFIDLDGNTQKKSVALCEENDVIRMLGDELESIIEEWGASVSREELNNIFLKFILKN
jgi:hypothetical protein